MRILLCEDYPSFVEIATRALDGMGYQVAKVSTNGHEAMYAVANEGPWDVVISDYDLGFGPTGDDVAAMALHEDVSTVVLWSSIRRDLPGEVRTSSRQDERFHLLEKNEMDALRAILRDAEWTPSE